MLRVVEVGSPYRPAPPGGSWPDGGAFFEWRKGMMDLILSLSDPTPAEVHAAEVGPLEVGVVTLGGPEVRVLYRVNGLADGDAPYELACLPEAERPDLDPLPAEGRYLMVLVLVNSTNGIVRAIRAVSLSHRVSESLRRAVLGDPTATCPMELAGQ